MTVQRTLVSHQQTAETRARTANAEKLVPLQVGWAEQRIIGGIGCLYGVPVDQPVITAKTTRGWKTAAPPHFERAPVRRNPKVGCHRRRVRRRSAAGLSKPAHYENWQSVCIAQMPNAHPACTKFLQLLDKNTRWGAADADCMPNTCAGSAMLTG